MKKILLLPALLLSFFHCLAQWTPLNSTTTQDLYDVDFLDPNYGVIVGTGGTILLTTNGGTTWADINNQLAGDVYSIKVINADTMFVSTFNPLIAQSRVYITFNAGTTWSSIGFDNSTNHKADIETANYNRIFTAANHLTSTSDNGNTWDTLLTNIGGITSLSILKFAKNSQTGHLSGNVSGFTSYSAYFFRSDDGGSNWYPNDLFSFPNSDALTTMSFIKADTVMLFTNDYNGFSPSNINGLVKTYDYTKTVLVSGDTVFSFTSQIVNAAMPAYMNDGQFLGSLDAFAFSENGNVYKTIDGGITWSVDYTGTDTLFSSCFTNGIGYAVGSNGTLIKYTGPTSVNENGMNDNISVYPALANDYINVDAGISREVHYTIISAAGKTVHSGMLKAGENKIPIGGYPPGTFYIKLQNKNGVVSKKFVVME